MSRIINSLERTTTVANLVSQIREKIILRHYQDGDSLTEQAVAKEYGASRGSVRTALQALESEGVIATLPTGRKRVMGITDSYISDLYKTRQLLECEAARQILDMARVDFTEMAAMVSRFRDIAAEPPEVMRRERTEVNMLFHRALLRMSRNRPLIQCWNTVDSMIEALIKLNSETLIPETHVDDYVVSHSKILEMFLANDHGVLDYLVFHTYDYPYRDTMDGLRKLGCV